MTATPTDQTDDEAAQALFQSVLEREERALQQSPMVMQAQIQHLQNRVVQLSLRNAELEAELEARDPAAADADGGDPPA